MIDIPIEFTDCTNFSGERRIEKPGMDSSLSKVPPVNPNPLPDIFATFIPKAATIGQRARDVLSPTPPVECLSHFTPSMGDKSMISPEFIIASVKLKISLFSIPLRRIAIRRADDW